MNFEKYKNTLKYPGRPLKLCSCGYSFHKKDNFCSNCGTNVEKEYEMRMSIFNSERKKYREHEANLLKQFKTDALDEVGLTDHPKADKAYYFAWEHGHSAGLQEVYNWLEEVSELILD